MKNFRNEYKKETIILPIILIIIWYLIDSFKNFVDLKFFDEN